MTLEQLPSPAASVAAAHNLSGPRLATLVGQFIASSGQGEALAAFLQADVDRKHEAAITTMKSMNSIS